MIDKTLNERQHTHGNFAENANASQVLKHAVKTLVTCSLTRVQSEALDNICQKMARILTGNPNHADSWHDIAGYATLAERDIHDNP